jgi:1-acyl-sn-glycerol-3-phosphate acyltransferase
MSEFVNRPALDLPEAWAPQPRREIAAPKRARRSFLPRVAPHLRVVAGDHELPKVLRDRDPAMIREIFPWLATVSDHYYRTDVEGAENLLDSASLIVSTHNGSVYTPDLYGLAVAYLRRFGLETPAFGLAHKVVFKFPGVGSFVRKFGGIPATPENASLALRHGFPLLVCPGGDVDALKPYSRRHEIMFGRRRGFVRLAIKEQVPIVPVVSVGAHEVMLLITDGRKLARTIRFDRLFRVKAVPISFGVPFGLGVAGLGAIPLPSKVRIRILPPIHLSEPRQAADQPDRVERAFVYVKDQMQRALNDLASNRRYPVFG